MEAGRDLDVVAFYLPQFHPVPENDEWWGRGFTEWRNVARARPLFPGHHQPHLPGELGFYDLRVPEVREHQAELAREHGVTAFCYYHYWFGGRRLLERPFAEVLASGRPDLPFLLCWANENWTRVWDGGSRDVLMPQAYSPEDDLAHLRWLAEAFADPRYVRVDGRPVFLVYRASDLPDPRRTTDAWRAEAARLGVGELYLCRVEGFASERANDPRDWGFDAGVAFVPDYKTLGRPLRRSVFWRGMRTLGMTAKGYRQNVFDYDTVVAEMLARPEPAYPRLPCVTVAWDNSARRKEHAVIYRDATPEAYERWLRESLHRLRSRTDVPHLMFVNAWNEWAEGSHLEPDERWGRAYLEATRRAVDAARGQPSVPSP
ncbi:MAG TPA: glycoside hydrolase family 99-like domain-containing protein [Mycobacteriales bacterium]|jgi:lipopolysaccharide biosynthesis protein|nr:glycoside hydrolase family 99-like domain-containing protein [Mycobacteriales bacterium]